MPDHSGKTTPTITPESEPYWAGCRRHALCLQFCDDCGQHQFYPRMFCCHCMSSAIHWVEVSGRGRVRSYTVVRRPVSEAYQAEIPYVVALIELDEGPTMMSNVVQCDLEDVSIGMPVEVIFEDWSEQISIPKFVPHMAT